MPYEEDDKDAGVWFLDHNYHEAMYEMFKKINAKEKIVGWYHSGPKLRSSDLNINELFRRYIPNPILTIVDVEPKGEGIPTDSYFAVEEIYDDGRATKRTFNHIPSSIEAEEAEEIGVEHLLRDVTDNAVNSLSKQVVQQLTSLRGLDARLLEIHDYIGQVLDGKLPINHQISFNLQDIFNHLPDLAAIETVKAFAVKTNDQLLIVYLSSIVRSVIALHKLIDNKLDNCEAE